MLSEQCFSLNTGIKANVINDLAGGTPVTLVVESRHNTTLYIFYILYRVYNVYI